MSDTNLQIENTETPCEKVVVQETDRQRRIRKIVDIVTSRNLAQGMMDLALITANCNQLKLVLSYAEVSVMFYVNVSVILFSLCLQIVVGFMMIFQTKNGSREEKIRTRKLIVSGTFLITIINMLIPGITVTGVGKPADASAGSLTPVSLMTDMVKDLL